MQLPSSTLLACWGGLSTLAPSEVERHQYTPITSLMPVLASGEESMFTYGLYSRAESSTPLCSYTMSPVAVHIQHASLPFSLQREQLPNCVVAASVFSTHILKDGIISGGLW